VREYRREIRLPEELKGRHASTELANGVLTVRLPKANPGPLEGIRIAAKRILPKIRLPQVGARANRR
jgi:HSP20 family molecular chaperone IbpA